MAIPGLSLPDPTVAPQIAPVVDRTQSHRLDAETEYRFEASWTAPLSVRLVSGNAELFGTELAPGATYNFRGTKAAIYTWQGCEIEVNGLPEADYVAEETTMMQAANVHFALEDLRSEASRTGKHGPRVMVLGPENAGKTSLIKILAAYGVKAGRQPVVLNLDPKQGLLGMPGALTATVMATILDVEEGWGSSSISGPSVLPVKMPLCYHYGCQDPEDNEKLFKSLVGRLGMAVMSRFASESEPRSSGCLIDTPGSLASGAAGAYERIEQIVADLSVDILLIIGSERLTSEMRKRLSTHRSVKIIKMDKSGGCVDRSDMYMKQLRQTQIRHYFYGHGSSALSPFTQYTDYNHLNVFRINDTSARASAFNPGDDDDDDEDDYQPTYTSSAALEKMSPSLMLQNSTLAVTQANASDSLDNIRDASVMWYVYIADVDDAKKRLKVVSPISGRVPPNALLYGAWPEGIPDLIA